MSATLPQGFHNTPRGYHAPVTGPAGQLQYSSLDSAAEIIFAQHFANLVRHGLPSIPREQVTHEALLLGWSLLAQHSYGFGHLSPDEANSVHAAFYLAEPTARARSFDSFWEQIIDLVSLYRAVGGGLLITRRLPHCCSFL